MPIGDPRGQFGHVTDATIMPCPVCGFSHMGNHFCGGIPRWGGAVPALQLTEADVRRIIREELAHLHLGES